MNKTFLSFFFNLILLLFYSDVNPQKKLFVGSKGTLESDSAFAFFQTEFLDSRQGRITEIDSDNDLVWIHLSDTTRLSPDESEIKTLRNYVNEGGRLLLTGEAFQLLNLMGIEKQNVQLRYVKAADEGYGRKLGMHSFISHSVFKGLNGGAYIWNPKKDTITRMWGFFGEGNIQGKTIAVDWAYIRLKENSRILLEYDYGKGKILAVGAYTHYAPANYNREHLNIFTRNCFDYLLEKKADIKNYYWDYNEPKITQSADLNSIYQVESYPWDEKQTLSIKSQFASDNYWDIAGERILVMGKENGGIDEIWIHPFMAFRDYELGIQFTYKDSVLWLNDQRPEIEVSPAYLKRVYRFRRAFLTEIISADPRDPVGVIHYEYRGVFPARMVIKVKSNLRFMWPYSEKAFRELRYSLTDNNNLLIQTQPDVLSSLITFNKTPVFSAAGQFENFIKKDTVYDGIPTEKMQVAGIFLIDLKMNDNIDVTFSGSNISKDETKRDIITAAKDPYSTYSRSVDYVNQLVEKNMSIKTPDSVFNEGYRWALIGADKFFVNTPGAGKSLTAGYSTTASGWDGEHAVNGRPGYGWYFGRDAQWSGFAFLDFGDFEKVKDILDNFNKYQDINGKIYHELTTSGAAHYDAADATPLYIILAGKYLKHSGDIEYFRKNWDYIKKAIDFCYTTDTDGDRLIENTNVGHGWVEGGSLYGAHTTLYLAACWAEALKESGYISEALGFDQEREKYLKDYETVKSIIENSYWNEKDNFYYYGKFKDGSYNPEKTILPSVPMYFNLFRPSKAENILDDYAGSGFTSDWGVRIISSENPLYNPSGYHYGSVWPLFTGWTSLAEYNYGAYLQGYTHLRNNLNVYKNFSKGYVEEVLNGAIYKPAGVCSHQCWSETMVLQPAIEGMLGFNTDALKKMITLSPRFPADWQYAVVENIKSGSDNISLEMQKVKSAITYKFTSSGNSNIIFHPSLPLLSEIEKVSLDGKPIEYELRQEEESLVLLTKFEVKGRTELNVYLKEGFSILPQVHYPLEGDSSQGLRIITSNLDGTDYQLELEGKRGNEYKLLFYSPYLKIYNNTEELNKIKENIYELKLTFDESEGYYKKKIKLNIK